MILLMFRKVSVTQRKKGPVREKGGSNSRIAGNGKGSSGKNLPDFGEVSFVVNEHAVG